MLEAPEAPETTDLGTPDRACQGVSPSDEPCNLPATVHCVKCDQWFCDAHAEDDLWHPCMLPEGDQGGES